MNNNIPTDESGTRADVSTASAAIVLVMAVVLFLLGAVGAFLAIF